MPTFIKTISLGLLTLTLMSGCAQSSLNQSNDRSLAMDKSRNVLSFADSLDDVLPSVVRIGTVKSNEAGNIGLSGIG